MKKFRIPYSGTLTVYVEVEAETQEEAIELAEQEDKAIMSFCGNGGYDKLVGVYPSDDAELSLEADEWLELEEDSIEEV